MNEDEVINHMNRLQNLIEELYRKKAGDEEVKIPLVEAFLILAEEIQSIKERLNR